MCLNVRGFLRNNTYPHDFEQVFLDDDGKVLSAYEAREFLFDELAKGHEVIPTCECDNFDYSGGGCQGHPVEDAGETA